ncbi:MAG: CDP-diacylglycerol--glycerol-3-phosphate 3-phosphatidyltransferase [Bacteriovoracales bacterium]|nr:CDP-diacylglycerol--glycerol-3-phosphate 3-phosphatidyltransferase [Bacteriovoracales bacterium]
MSRVHLEIESLPNVLTLFRIALIPVIVATLFLEKMSWPILSLWHGKLGYIAAYTFAAAAVTDFIDGYIARKRGLVTTFGSFLDPIADKFLVVSSLIMLLYLDRLEVFVVIVLILREFYITSLRLLASGEGLQISAVPFGKWKTAFQLVGIPLLMVNERHLGILMPFWGSLCIYASVVLSLCSAVSYSVGVVKKFKLKLKERKIKKKKQESVEGQIPLEKSRS